MRRGLEQFVGKAWFGMAILIAFLEDPDGYKIERASGNDDPNRNGPKPYRTLNGFCPFYRYTLL